MSANSFQRLALVGGALLLLWGCHASETQIEVLRATRDLPAGTVVRAEHLARVRTSKRQAPTNIVRAAQQSVVVGHALLADVYAGDPILHEALTPKPVGRIARYVRRRGVAYEIALRSSRMVRRLDHIDVFGLVTHEGKRGINVLLQDVIVYRARPASARPASAQPASARRDAASEDTRRLTLLLLPEEAQLLALARRPGPLFAALRHREAVGQVQGAERVTPEQLFETSLHLRLTKQRVTCTP